MNQYDVIAVGGDCAGPAAATAAARSGTKTLLIEKNPFAGVTWTAGSMMAAPVMRTMVRTWS